MFYSIILVRLFRNPDSETDYVFNNILETINDTFKYINDA